MYYKTRLFTKTMKVMQSFILRKTITLLLLFFISSITLTSQNLFTGRIVYELNYLGSTIDLATLEILPREVNITAKREMVRTEMESGELTQIKIADSESGTISTVLEVLREKYVIHKSREAIRQNIQELGDPKITFTDETKEILGYNCKKAEAVMYDHLGQESIVEIYYTEEIPGKPFNFDLPYKEIPGLMLQYEIRVGNINMRYEAKSIRSRAGIFIGSRNFRVPRDAKETTFEELKEKLQ